MNRLIKDKVVIWQLWCGYVLGLGSIGLYIIYYGAVFVELFSGSSIDISNCNIYRSDDNIHSSDDPSKLGVHGVFIINKSPVISEQSLIK